MRQIQAGHEEGNVKKVSFAALSNNDASALNRALADPGVQTLARSMHLNLQDPATRHGLLAMAQQHVDNSPEIDTNQKQMLLQVLAPGQSTFTRSAIRTYREIAAMN